MLPDLHTDFSGGRSGGLLFPSLSEFSTVCCDPHKGFGIVNKAEVDVLLFTQGPIYGEGMKLMATSFKSSHACTAALSAPSPAAGHRRPTPPLETPGHSQQVWASLLWGHCSFLLVLLCTGFCLCPPRVCFPDCVSSGGSMVGLMATSSKRAYAIPKSAAPRAPAPAAVHR